VEGEGNPARGTKQAPEQAEGGQLVHAYRAVRQ